jgi:hypothetical protein
MGAGTSVAATLGECPGLRLLSSNEFDLFDLNYFASTSVTRTFNSFDEAGTSVDDFAAAAYATIKHAVSFRFDPDGRLSRSNDIVLARSNVIGGSPACLLSVAVSVSTTPGCTTDSTTSGSFEFVIEP